MLKQQLQQKLQQKLSPAQIQVIKMLELPTLELEERILQELEENPVLEEGTETTENTPEENFDEDYNEKNELNNEDFNIDDYISDDEVPDYKLRTHNTSPDDKHENIPFSAGTTFHENLIQQLGLQQINEHQHTIAEFVIGNIDEDGYLRRTVESMVDDMAFQQGFEVTDPEMEQMVALVQTLDPAGVGARNLQECLLLQLERRTQTEQIEHATRVIKNTFNEFSNKHYERICDKLHITSEQLKEAIAEIVKLNPKPGNAWDGNLYEKNMTVVTPDFILENDNGELIIHLNNNNIPSLRVNREYNEMLQDYSNTKEQDQTREMKDAILFVKQKIDSARWFIDAIRQRNDTLLRTMTTIIKLQREFFIEGDETFLKPMILKDVADITGYDISTISRVSNSKYVQTEFGIYPLKYFFSEAMTNDAGEEISTREIKKILQESIEKEDKQKPLTDEQLTVVLKLQGYPIARRTVAKYREQLNISVARLRKEI